MPIEEARNIYLGKTATHVNVYLGGASAKLAQFLYERAGIPFELQKTNVFASIDDFSHLERINAVTFKNNEDDHVTNLKTLLEAYDILKRHTIVNTQERIYSHRNIYHDVDIIFRNKHYGTTLLVRSKELPEYKDNVLTCLEWDCVGEYVPSQVDNLCDVLRTLFHGKVYNRRSDLFDKLLAFKDLYLA